MTINDDDYNASLLQAMRVPVIIASEAYKFCEKVQLDSVVYNELGSAFEIVNMRSHLEGEVAGDRQKQEGDSYSACQLLQLLPLSHSPTSLNSIFILHSIPLISSPLLSSLSAQVAFLNLPWTQYLNWIQGIEVLLSDSKQMDRKVSKKAFLLIPVTQP